jgi:hypothetical protein
MLPRKNFKNITDDVYQAKTSVAEPLHFDAFSSSDLFPMVDTV